jgi:hypothetical protein
MAEHGSGSPPSRRRGRYAFCAAAVAVAFAASVPAQQVQQRQPLTTTALVAALDEQLQLRFLDVRLGFGMSRLCGPVRHGPLGRPAQTLRRLPQPGDPRWSNWACGSRDWAAFEPRNPQEQWVAREVNRAKVEIWAFLVGARHRTLEGPVVLGNPNPQQMDEVRRTLLPRVAQTPIPVESLSGWQVQVKPVKASRNECIACHTQGGTNGAPVIPDLKRGDPIGYLVYLYR